MSKTQTPSTPVYDWLQNRRAGVLLHPTSLPSRSGVGTLGESAFDLIDFIADSGLKYWQVCPLGPTSFGDSPYQCFSAFAGNPYLIDMESLIVLDLLEESDVEALRELPHESVDYGELYVEKWPVLEKAFKNFKDKELKVVSEYEPFADFCKKNDSWLDPFASFMALKNHHKGGSWDVWADELSSYAKAKDTDLLNNELAEAVEAQKFYQYIFYGQWRHLRKYAKTKSVEIIGDIPIFVAYDSADCWANPDIFLLDKKGKPKSVAGVPPDYFSADGQLWGNPLFDWKKLKKEKYSWWLDRFRTNFELYDVVRIDHFRGFQDYWSVPAKAKTAKDGKWCPGPGLDFFKAVVKEFPDAQIIAEDLGIITDEVRDLLENTGLPGMAVLHFAFSGQEDNLYLPHNLKENSIVYTGTHDNDTTVGWYETAGDEIQHQVRVYLSTSGDDIAFDLLDAAFKSIARMAIVPLQDLLRLDSSARMNTPGVGAGNWQWRFSDTQMKHLQDEIATKVNALVQKHNR